MEENAIKPMIEFLVDKHKNITFSELSCKDQKNLIQRCLNSSIFDDIETFIDGIFIPDLIRNMLNGIYDEDLKEEIEERLFSYFEPIIDRMLEKEYESQYVWEDKATKLANF